MCVFVITGAVLFNPVGVFVSGMGQLLVWEWQSESYVFKQQGHFNNMASLAYSPDGQYIATGGEDGKVSPPPVSPFVYESRKQGEVSVSMS